MPTLWTTPSWNRLSPPSRCAEARLVRVLLPRSNGREGRFFMFINVHHRREAEMLRRICSAMIVATALSASAVAQAERATFILTDGERRSGTMMLNSGSPQYLNYNYQLGLFT